MTDRNRPTRSGQSRGRARGHHSVPKHLLRRFANDDGRLTVVQLRPEPEVLRRQHPRRIGALPHLNTWTNEDGTRHERLETEPLNRIDTAGADAIRRTAEYAIKCGADARLRIVDWPAEDRVGLYLTIAGLMVRSPDLREQLDEHALPTLLAEMRQRLDAAEKDRTENRDAIALLRGVLDTPGAVTLDPSRNRHQAALVPLIKTVGIALGENYLAAVRRLPAPALHTGSEPVVLFPTHRIDQGTSCARLLTERDDPVRMWDEHHDMLASVEAIVAGLAGLAVAIDPRTVVLLFNPETEEGCGLMFMASELTPSTLGGLVNLAVTANSRWIAGRDDCDFLQMTVRAIERAN